MRGNEEKVETECVIVTIKCTIWSCKKYMYAHFMLLSVLQASALLNTHEEQKQKIVFLYKFLANASTVYTDVFPVM